MGRDIDATQVAYVGAFQRVWHAWFESVGGVEESKKNCENTPHSDKKISKINLQKRSKINQDLSLNRAQNPVRN